MLVTITPAIIIPKNMLGIAFLKGMPNSQAASAPVQAPV